MKKILKNEILLSLTVVLGLCASLLHSRMMSTAIDAKGLLISGHPLTLALWVLSLGFLIFAFSVSRVQRFSAPYRDHFPPCTLRGLVSMAGGAAVTAFCVRMVHSSQLLPGIIGTAAGLSMVFTGLRRLQGRQPSPLFHCIVCVFFIVDLVLSFRQWSADPQLQDYVLPLMASLSLMLFAYHRASSDADIMNPGRTAFFSLCAAFFCLAALSDPAMRLLYLGAGLWAVGAAPTLEPIEAPEEEEM